MKVFFYVLFMDEGVLSSKGICPSETTSGYVDNYSLRVGERATLIREPGARAYGIVMELSAGEIAALYAEPSVSDYVAERVIASVSDGTRIEASCYNLPPELVSGTNKTYASSLLALAGRLSFPDTYLDQIRQMAK